MSQSAPFMSFLLPTTGPVAQVRESLLSLAAQTSYDFEVLLVHGPDEPGSDDLLDDLLDSQPETLRSRLRPVRSDGASGGADSLAWLGEALDEARGDYVTLSGGLTWFAHWVELCQENAGDGTACLRGLVLHQQAGTASVGGLPGVRGDGAPVRRGADRFSPLQHLGASPTASRHGFALPRGVLGRDDLRPDADLGTAVERDLLLRTANRTGVIELGEVVALRCELDQGGDERPEDLERLLAKVEASGLELPAGSVSALLLPRTAGEGTTAQTAQLRHLLELKDQHIANIEAQLVRLTGQVERLEARVAKKEAQVARLRARVDRQTDQRSAPETSRLAGVLRRIRRRD